MERLANPVLRKKGAIIEDLAAAAAKAPAIVAVDYCGLTVAEITALRKSAREAGVYLRVAKNTLVRRALHGTPYADLSRQISGPLMWVFSGEEPGAAARLIRDFAREHEALSVRLVGLENQALAPEALNELAELPGRDEALAQLMGAMTAPVAMLARLLNEPAAMLVRALAAAARQRSSE